jgi:hypothetical protein
MERALSWKRVCYLLVAVCVVQFLFIWSGPASFSPTSHFAASSKAQTPAGDINTTGLRTTVEDEFDDCLTQEQCNGAFPDLYYEVDRAVAYWRGRSHTITEEDVQIDWRNRTFEENPNAGGAMRILIHDNKLRIVHSKLTIGHIGYRERGLGLLQLLHRALESATASGEQLPTIEAAIIVEDISDPPTKDGTHTFWTWTSKVSEEVDQRHWLVPNFDFWSARPPQGSYGETHSRALQYNKPFAQKIPQIVWRGTEWVSFALRRSLIEATTGKDWADVRAIAWDGSGEDDKMPSEEMCKYAMTVHTEGTSYSGRLKYLLMCDSLPFIHKREWTTYWYHLLKSSGPDQNYVEVERDWSDLEAKVEYYLSHPEEAQRIIDNHLATFRRRYLTRAAQSCYVRRLIQGYSQVAFKPNVWRRLKHEGEAERPRGVSFETFINMPSDFEPDEFGGTGLVYE